MNDLDLSVLPDLPQRPLLTELAQELWADPTVSAVWLGGSLARGEADAFSDVDLRVAFITPPEISEAMPSSAQLLTDRTVYSGVWRVAPDAVLHQILLDDGQIYDLWVQTTGRPPSPETRRVLGCRDAVFRAQLTDGEDPSVQFPAADPEAIRRVIGDFWMGQRKHQKVRARGLALIEWDGEHRLRQTLLRLWFVLETGLDCGPPERMTIHTLSPMDRVIQEAHGAHALALLNGEVGEAIQEEVARVGQALAERLGFKYPAAAEEAARQGWGRFPAA